MPNETPEWTYTDELARAICERAGEGESLRLICADQQMPDEATVLDWLDRYPAFRELHTFMVDTYVEVAPTDPSLRQICGEN